MGVLYGPVASGVRGRVVGEGVYGVAGVVGCGGGVGGEVGVCGGGGGGGGGGGLVDGGGGVISPMDASSDNYLDVDSLLSGCYLVHNLLGAPRRF